MKSLKKQFHRAVSLLFALILLTSIMPNDVSAAASVTAEIPLEVLVAGDLPDKAETFTFTIKQVTSNAPLPSSGSSLAVSGSGKGVFKINYSHAGTYVYTVSEAKGDAANYSFDDSVYTLTVQVDNSSSGLDYEYFAEKNSKKTDSLSFTNTYQKPHVNPPENTSTLTISNTITGTLGKLENPVFNFTIILTDPEGNHLKESYEYYGNGVPGGTISSGDKFSLRDGESIVIYGLPIGTKYQIIQENSNSGGYTTMAQSSGGLLSPTGNISFWVNHKEGFADPKPVSVDLKAEKTVDGNVPSGSEYSFYLLDNSNHVFQTKQNNNGVVSFDTITYTVPGTYYVNMSEKIGTDKKMTYDSSTYTFKIIVTDEGEELKQETYVYRDGEPYSGKIIFDNKTNQSGSNSGKMTVTITKVWENDEDHLEKRPDEITIYLLRNGDEFEAVTLNSQNGWRKTFTGLLNSGIYKYSVKEKSVDEYMSVYAGNSSQGFVITNYYVEVPPYPSIPPDPDSPSAHHPTDDPPSQNGSNGSNDSVNGGGNTGQTNNSFIDNILPGSVLDKTPKTNDNSLNGLWLTLCLLSAVGMILLLWVSHRKKKCR